MLGKIIEVTEDSVLVNLSVDLNKVQNLVNHYVIIEDNDKKIIGEITSIKDKNANVLILGQLTNEGFVFGTTLKPSFSSSVKIVSNDKVPYIIGIEKYEENKHLYFGKSPIYPEVKLGVRIDDFFTSHFAIFGSTGSGKSCSVARILQNLLQKQEYIPYRSNIFIFDAYGEYTKAFDSINTKALDINFKLYTTNLKADHDKILKIPLWLLTVDDLALLLNAEKLHNYQLLKKL